MNFHLPNAIFQRLHDEISRETFCAVYKCNLLVFIPHSFHKRTARVTDWVKAQEGEKERGRGRGNVNEEENAWENKSEREREREERVRRVLGPLGYGGL